MKCPRFLHERLLDWAVRKIDTEADFVIRPTNGQAYMRRWFVVRRNRFLNVYLHHVLRSDDDRALHDHPWPSVSIMLWGAMGEVYKGRYGEAYRAIAERRIVWRGARFAHRLVLPEHSLGAITLFITGPRIRSWGFYCPKGWRHWREFTTPDDSSSIGRGCD